MLGFSEALTTKSNPIKLIQIRGSGKLASQPLAITQRPCGSLVLVNAEKWVSLAGSPYHTLEFQPVASIVIAIAAEMGPALRLNTVNSTSSSIGLAPVT